MSADIERLVDTTEAARLLDVPRARIAEWKARGRIVPADSIPGPGASGRVPLYRLEELRPLVEAWRARRREGS